MKQIYILLILIATFFIHSFEIKGQGSFDIVDPGPQVVSLKFDLALQYTDGDYQINIIIQPGSVNYWEPIAFQNGIAQIEITLFNLGENNISLSIYAPNWPPTLLASNNINLKVYDYLWTGSEGVNWHFEDNWNPSSIPGENDFIGIPTTSNNPEISSNNVTVDNVFIYTNAKLTISSSRQLTVKAGGELIISEDGEVIIDNSAELLNDGSVIIEDNGKLTIGPTGSWTAYGTVTNNAGIEGILVKSDASATGSVIIKNGLNINATVQRYMKGREWHVISSPVSGQGLNAFLKENITFNEDRKYYAMARYIENKGSGSGGWGPYFTEVASGNLDIARGYLAGISIDKPLEFKGNLAHDQVNRTITRGANGWNAIGNPFPSAIGVTSKALSEVNFFHVNRDELDDAFAAIYIYDPGSGEYGDYIILNNSETGINQDYIQPGQGFLVKSVIGEGEVSFTPEMRFHEHTSTFFKKSATIPWPTIRLKASGNDKEATTVITFHSNMTRDLDPTYDAGQFGGDPNFRLFTRLVEGNSEIDFAIQALPDFGFEDMVIPVGFDFSGNGEIIFSAENLTLPAGAYAILEDRTLGKFTNLETDSYVVNLDEDIQGPGRFYLHTDMQVTSTENILRKPELDLKFYSYGKEIFINGQIDGIVHASLYDLLGRRIKTVRLHSADRNSFNVDDVKTGIYLLRIVGESINLSSRVFIE